MVLKWTDTDQENVQALVPTKLVPRFWFPQNVENFLATLTRVFRKRVPSRIFGQKMELII